MQVWRSAFSSSYDHLHIKVSPNLRNMSPALSFRSFRRGSVRGRLMPKSGGKWKSEGPRAASRSFVPRNFYGEERAHLHCHSALPPCSEGVRRPRPDPPVPTSSSSSIRHAALHLCLGYHQSSKELTICPFAFKLNKSVK